MMPLALRIQCNQSSTRRLAIFDAQAGHLSEIAEVGRKQHATARCGDGRNFQIHCADANLLLPIGLEKIGRRIVEG